MSLEGCPRYEFSAESPLYPKELSSLSRPPKLLRVLGDPLALRPGVLLRSRPDWSERDVLQAERVALACARAQVTLHVARDGEPLRAAALACVRGGGTCVVCSSKGLLSDAKGPRNAAWAGALEEVARSGGACISTLAWDAGRARRGELHLTERPLRALANATILTTGAATLGNPAIEALLLTDAGLAQAVLSARVGKGQASQAGASLARETALALARVDASPDPLLPLAKRLWQGEVLCAPKTGTLLFLSDYPGFPGVFELVCRAGVRLWQPSPQLSDERALRASGADAGTVTYDKSVSCAEDLAEALATLPRRALRGAVSSVIEQPQLWLCSEVPLVRPRTEPERASVANNPALGVARLDAESRAACPPDRSPDIGRER